MRAESLRAFVSAVLERAGMPPADAAIVADGMVWADLRGIDPHGVSKLPILLRRLRTGGTAPAARLTVVRESATTALVDAGGAWGQVAATRAMQFAVEKARASQLAAVVVRDSGSLGALGYYSLIAARASLVGLTITNSMPLLAPWGGARKIIGNQAYSLAVPSGGDFPLLLDTSNSATSWGWIKMAAERGEQLPPGLALDREGRPTVDPVAAAEGLLQPAGGHKGYGLALVWEVLTGVLAGLAFGPDVGGPEAFDRPMRVSHFLLALDPAAFLPPAEFRARVDRLVDLVHANPPAPGVERVYLPGERGFLTAREREASGIPLPLRRREELAAVAAEYGIPAPE